MGRQNVTGERKHSKKTDRRDRRGQRQSNGGSECCLLHANLKRALYVSKFYPEDEKREVMPKLVAIETRISYSTYTKSAETDTHKPFKYTRIPNELVLKAKVAITTSTLKQSCCLSSFSFLLLCPSPQLITPLNTHVHRGPWWICIQRDISSSKGNAPTPCNR